MSKIIWIIIQRFVKEEEGDKKNEEECGDRVDRVECSRQRGDVSYVYTLHMHEDSNESTS